MLVEKLLEVLENKDIQGNAEIYSNSHTSKLLNIYKKYLEGNTVCLLTSSKKSAEDMQADLLSLTSEVYIFPEIDVLKRFTTKSNDLYQISIKILENLSNKKNMILLLPMQSIYRSLKKPKDFKNSFFNITLENYPSFEKLPKLLLDLGYNLVDTVENIGEYSKRGSIIDIYSTMMENPMRLDYFDDELDSIKSFDLVTQKSIDRVDSLKVYPTSDFFLTEKEKTIVVEKLEQRLNDSELNDNINFDDIQQELKSKITLYKESGIFDDLDVFSNYIYEECYSIFDYIDNEVLVFFDSYTKIEDKNISLQEYFVENLKEISTNYLHQDVLDLNAFDKFINSDNIKHNLTLLKSSNKLFGNQVNQGVRDLEFFTTSQELGKELVSKIKNNFEVVILVQNKKQRDYVEKILFDYDIYDEVRVGVTPGKIHIEEANFQLTGFESVDRKFILITPREIFKNSVTRKKKVSFKYSNSEKIRSYQDLNIGDYIVHIHHGIGIYQGIENIEVTGVNKDFLKVVYDGGDVIYVDIDNMQYIQKYMSSTENRKPKLNKLGTKKWQQIKSKVRKEIEDISEELIRMYIKRELNEGFAFSPDTPMQQDFEQDFLYEATIDQEKATFEIKQDMQKTRPMDRLLCGDVGFGKTEVAMRVAFKAVMDSKQVAVLVPTTLLAEQHYENFIARFANFPINIEVVNRFKSTKEINEISERLHKGQIDIIVGTHKLLNDKFKYKDLGLLIIDEEQRFGVKHKEKIKHLKNMIDVLTLSATPIPRTLHMSLIGIRDLSVIETPPTNRQPIQTFIARENPNIIREAVLNEIERNGQIFYLYNKVESIEEKYLELKKLLPEINIAYAHGRMSQKELENIMTDLINKEYDMLITTTIIETGIDISNVNTLIVEDADKFGLSQLYQIRGRVGRSSREAYAYFMYKPNKMLTENSEKRLAAIKNFTALGSGFKIAMQDLSIRGAGDTLGSKQHGFIDSVGYTLYSQMLEKELQNKKEVLQPILEEDKTKTIEYYEEIVNNISKECIEDIFEIKENVVEIKLNVDAFIPKEYISKDADKLYFYKELAKCTNETSIFELVDEMIDRFSDYGIEVENLLDITMLRVIAENIKVDSIKELANKIVINFKKEVLKTLNGPMLFEKLINHREVRIQVRDTLVLEFDKTKENNLKKLLKILKLITPSIGESMNEQK